MHCKNCDCVLKFRYQTVCEEIMKKKLQTAFDVRQYMISEDFELYYYEDRDLTKVASHSHDYYEFCFFMEGNVSMKIDKNIYPVHPGDMIFIPPYLSHKVVIHNNDIPYKRFVFWVSKDFCERLHKEAPNYTYIIEQAQLNECYLFHLDGIAFNTAQSKIIRLLEEMQTEHFGKQAQVSLYVKDLILHINRLAYEQIEPQRYNEDSTLATGLISYIDEHLEEVLTLDRLANEFYASKYYIAHIFKENFGISVHQYILKKRLSLCRDALLSKRNISELCQLYGFTDYSSFYRAFKKEFGVSPKAFRDAKVEDTTKSN